MAPPARGSRPRHIPQRTCVACRQTGAKRQLVRVVRAPDGSVTIDIPEADLQTLNAYAQRLSGTSESVVSLPLQLRQD